jgi:hypothetical protein
MSVSVQLGEIFVAGIPEVTLEAPFRPGNSYAYDPAGDGQRFVVNILRESASAHPLTLVQNWTASISRD